MIVSVSFMKKILFPFFFCFVGLVTQSSYSQMASESLVIHNGAFLNIEQALSKYIQYNSISGNEKAAGDWLKRLCVENNLFIKQMGNENGKYNFAASLYPLSEQLPNIIFLNHIDVVPAGEYSNWIHDPFSGKIEDNEIWGRGAFDNKGNAVMQLYSLIEIKRKYHNKQLPFNITFLAVSSEETQTDGGVKYVVNNFLKELNPEVVIGEGSPGLIGMLDPSSKIPLFSISVAHKRALWLELELNIETSSHGSVTPKEYVTKEMNAALYQVLKKEQKPVFTDLNVKVLKQLGKVQGGFKGWFLKHPKLFKPILIPQLRKTPEMFSIFSNTITLTSIESYSEVINVIPSKVTARLDCRLLPTVSSEIFLAELTKKLGNDNIKIKILQSMPDIKYSNNNSIYYQSIDKAIKHTYPTSNVITILLPNFNDIGIFRQAGVPGFAISPVILEKKYLETIHNINERIPVSILAKGQEVYVHFINELLED